MLSAAKSYLHYESMLTWEMLSAEDKISSSKVSDNALHCKVVSLYLLRVCSLKKCFLLKIKVIFCSLKKCSLLQSCLYYICWEYALEKCFFTEKIKSCLQSLLCWEYTHLRNASAEIKVISQSLLLRHALCWDQSHLLFTALKARFWRFSLSEEHFSSECAHLRLLLIKQSIFSVKHSQQDSEQSDVSV